ncbi:MAG: phosphate/phosphite/phosphonate ABC transporter substrate-binding protein [Roseobacter sp.]
MTASLPMYDTSATTAATDRLWQAIRQTYGTGPKDLDRHTDPHVTWSNPDLVLSQTCGLPYRSALHDSVQLVGTPDYGLSGCAPGYYYSIIIVRREDPRTTLSEFTGSRLARNDIRSQSGWAAIKHHITEAGAPDMFANNIFDTGAHALSAQAVVDGQADIAAIDAVTWQFLCRDTDVPRGLRVLGQTTPTPGLPLIAGPLQDAKTLFSAVSSAINGIGPDDRATLMLNGLVKIPTAAYLAVPLP